MSRIVYGEIFYSIVHRWGLDRSDELFSLVTALPITVVSVDDALIDEAAAIKARYPISYADCFVAALSIRNHSKIITGDTDFRLLAERGIVKVHWLGA